MFLSLFLGCTQKPSMSDLVIKNGLYYEKGSTTPYSGKIESKYSTGKDSILGLVKDGKFDGLVISFYQNGKIKDSVVYKMGGKVLSKSYTEDGSPVCDCNEIYYNESKKVWMTSSSEKVFDGTCISYWDNKNKKSSKIVKYGKLREKYEWYNNGNEKESLIYDEDGKSKRKSYGYENGKPKQKEVYENGKPIKSSKYYETGEVQGEWELVNNRLNYKEYRKDGKLKVKFVFNENIVIPLDQIKTFEITNPEDFFNLKESEIPYSFKSDDKKWETDMSFQNKIEMTFIDNYIYEQLDKGSEVYFENGSIFYERTTPNSEFKSQLYCSNLTIGRVNGLIYNGDKKIIGLTFLNDIRPKVFYYLFQGEWLPETFCNVFKGLPIERSTSLEELNKYIQTK
jgi:antitoxin component YwqK of YwqJK toxin-antitoxin module